MRNLRYLPLILIACVNLSILPVKAEEVLKPSELPAKHLVEEGNRKKDLNDYEGAISDYKAALKIKPDYARAYYNLGIAASALCDPHGEIFYFSKAFELDPTDYEALTARGLARLDIQEIKKAKDDFALSLKLNPQEKRTHVGKGIAGLHEGDYSAALSSLDKAIQIDPKFSPAYHHRALVYRYLSRVFSRKFYAQKAISDYTQAIQFDPEYVQIYKDRGTFYLILGTDHLAISDFQKAADLLAKQNRAEEHAEMIEVINTLKEIPKVAETS